MPTRRQLLREEILSVENRLRYIEGANQDKYRRYLRNHDSQKPCGNVQSATSIRWNNSCPKTRKNRTRWIQTD